MQLGMIRLRRMGAKLIERITCDAHQCVVFEDCAGPGAGVGFGRWTTLAAVDEGCRRP